MYLITLKTIISIVAIYGLIFISERNPKLGGLLAGLPLGVGIMIFFYGIEQGIDFVILGIPYGVSGLVSMLAFTIGFYWGGKRFLDRPLLHVASATLFGLIAFFCVSYGISLVEVTLISSLVIFLGGFMFSVLFFKYIPIDTNSIASPKKMTLLTGVFRVVFVVAFVLFFTGIASLIGSKWAGIMASFPITLCPLLIILAYSYKDEVYPVVLKNFSYSIATLVVFYLFVFGLFPIIGVYLGTLISYLICLIYVFFLKKI
ncbi:MFS transporter [bacterium]|jgi:hypothetical protein|nr:MFS transporter [bacterium]